MRTSERIEERGFLGRVRCAFARVSCIQGRGQRNYKRVRVRERESDRERGSGKDSEERAWGKVRRRAAKKGGRKEVIQRVRWMRRRAETTKQHAGK